MTAPDRGAEGPWRVSPQFRVAVLTGIGDLGGAAAAARLTGSLTGAGLPLAEARAVPPGGLGAALKRATAAGMDLLVVEARTVLSAQAAAELRRVADLDPMVAAAVPRFAAVPGPPHPGAAPALDYGLLPDARATYIKASALALVAGNAPAADGPDDLVAPLLALNRLGFRVAVAGRAEALHPDGPAMAAPDTIPAAWRPALLRQRAAAPARADALMRGLEPGADGRLRVAFDLSHAGPGHSGTTGLARALVARAAARWADLALTVVATPEAFAAHFADLGPVVTRADPADRDVYAALIRLGQPFLWREIDAAVRRAPVLVLVLLDTIGFDCQHDAPDELDALWRFCLAQADGILFNSGFTARQFARRFDPPACPAAISLHSLALADYRLGPVPDAPRDGTVLVIGNAMPHKRLHETASALARAGLARPVAVLGLPPGAVPGVDARPSGGITAAEMTALYGAARVVVYPSVYEGFGFPILDALAHRRPILVRDLPPYAEIAGGLPERANIHVFSDEADLLRRLADPPTWSEARADGPARDWDDAADDLRATLDRAIAGADRARVVRRIDALRGRMSYMRARAFGDAEGADDLDRLAWLSGRLVQGGVLWLGRHIPGTRALLAAAHRGLDRLKRASGR